MIESNQTSRLPVIALVGRANVGKSTIFNYLLHRRASLIVDFAGTTRDRIYGTGSYADRPLQVIDTGGIQGIDEHPWAEQIKIQTEMAIREADIVFFVVDASVGILPGDEDIADLLRRQNKPVVIAANKAETEKSIAKASEFYALGFDKVFPISARQGLGFEELMESAFSKAGELATPTLTLPSPDRRERGIALAVLGKPNAGKSSFINKLLGEERFVTSDVPGTTIDAIDAPFEYGGQQFLLVDTAGIRRKRSIGEELEKKAVATALRALDRADVTLLMVDANEGLTEQDLKIASFIVDKGKACIVVVNKWDLISGEKRNIDKFTQKMRDLMPFMSFAPIRFISAKTGSRVFDVLETVRDVYEQSQKRITTGELNRFLKAVTSERPPSPVKGKVVKVYYGAQVSVAPPTFVMTCTNPDLVHFSYRRFLINRLREAFSFKGVPIKLLLRGRSGEAK